MALLFKVSGANAMLNLLRANDGNGYTVRGFRSSFEDWGARSYRCKRARSSAVSPAISRSFGAMRDSRSA